MGQRPDLKIALKPRDGGGDRVYLLAFWRRENGKLSGDVDRKVRGLRVFLEGGGHVDIKRGPDGKLTHWIDAFEGDGQPQQSSGDRHVGGREFADDSDDLPF